MVRMLALLASLAAAPLRADPAVYDFTVGGIKAAELQLWPRIAEGRYLVRSRAQTTGLVGAFFRFRIEGEAQGRLRGGMLAPEAYAAKTVGGRRVFDVAMRYQSGVPKVLRLAVEQDEMGEPLEPATQGGTLDPLSATLALLRDLPRGALCQQRVTVFDGRRRSEVVLAGDLTEDLQCSGVYRRLDGFTAEDMAEQVTFPVALRYRPAGEGVYHVDEFRFTSGSGTAVLNRR